MNITVIGLGYIGLPTAALLAQSGHRVYGYDVNAQLRHSLQRGSVPPMEEPVQQAVRDALQSSRLHVVDRVPNAGAYIMCLPTPTHRWKARPCATSRRVLARLPRWPNPAPSSFWSRRFRRVPPSGSSSARCSDRNKAIEDFHVAHCPERVIPGSIMQELRANARVVGGRTPSRRRGRAGPLRLVLRGGDRAHVDRGCRVR